MAKRICSEIVKFLKLIGNSDINRVVDMSSFLSYATWLKETPKLLAPSTIVNKLRNVELAIEHVQCQYMDDDIENRVKRLSNG